ncbi:MAG: hypothetical protein ACOH13_09390 [Flavobacteriales bacterium]
MERRNFLRLAGVAGVASMVPGAAHAHDRTSGQAPAMPEPGGGCVLIPSETAGPFPLDLSGISSYFRTDIREEQAGADLRLRLRVIGNANCFGMANCRVDAWHCNADGYYSGFTTNAHLGQQNNNAARWLRGIQLTDANGEVEFLTKFPGWYPGRTVHIHFQIFVSSMLQATSQLCFPTAEKNALLTSESPYTIWGADPVTPAMDGVFVDGYALQVATLTFDALANEYASLLEVAINGTGTGSTGLAALEPETGGQFTLGQNFPNPFTQETSIPFSLAQGGDITVELFDSMGRRVAEIVRDGLPAGGNAVSIDLKKLGLLRANYVYQLTVRNANGVFRQCKLMTMQK